MYFPVYLAADYGWPGWVAFALPNVIGAAAMGVLARGAGDDFERRHARALGAFSIVTIAFHAAFLSWFLAEAAAEFEPIRQGWVGSAIAAILVLLAWAMARCSWRGLVRAGVIVWIASIACAAAAARTSPTLALPLSTGARPIGDLWLGVPALMLGFFGCPWLDLTFWRTRRETPGRTGDAAFVLGFGVFFLAMIAFTLFYAASMARGSMSIYVVAHLAGQSVFTMAAHWRCRADRRAAAGIARAGAPLDGALLAALLGGLLLGPISSLPQALGHTRNTRLAYELFMSCYGLIFPAYAWIVMLPRFGAVRRAGWWWLGALALAGPMFAAGYIGQRAIWLVPGVAVVLVTPLAARWLGAGR